MISHASADERFRDHPGVMLHGIESYIAVPLLRRDGSYFGTLCAMDPAPTELTEEDLQIFHLLAHLISLELEAEEVQARRDIEFQALEDLIAIAAHDLRRPLTTLYGRLQLLVHRLRRGVEDMEILPRIEGLSYQARQVVMLSDSLLDLARVQIGHFSIERAPFDLVALAGQLVEEAQMAAPEHTFILEAPAHCPIVADEARLSQVLRNLLDNASKYAPPDRSPIRLRIERVIPEQDRGYLLISVTDPGSGVQASELPRLFERQYRSPSAVKSGLEGSGLGLYIAHQIVTAHGGSIRAENVPEGGLRVQVTLPLE